MNLRFFSSIGLGSRSGKWPSGVQYVLTRSSGSWSSSGPTIGPPMPLPPSATTFIRLTFDGSMNAIAPFWKSALMSTSSDDPPPGGSGMPSCTIRRMSWMPESPERAIAPSRTSFAPV